MKYPQLVSTRAVNAISDWLVSRLEQLGVEAPLIYSRLLLSLLHSSVQINDPIEFSNLETYLANRKGNKRFPRCDTDTLKKIAAIQCLMDTVSSEQEITKVENLVEELCHKLRDIEKQQNRDEEELSTETPIPNATPATKGVETEDPRKRYYRAFPALSKEMEDSVWISNRNTKSLTWPTGNNVVVATTENSSETSVLNNTTGVKRKTKRRRNQGKLGSIRKNSFGGNSSSPTWDTDFEGSWEMGRDLIKEFIIMQNNRNRSTSESDAGNNNIHRVNHFSKNENLEKRRKSMLYTEDDEEFYEISSHQHIDKNNKLKDDSLIIDAIFDDDAANNCDQMYQTDMVLPNEISKNAALKDNENEIFMSFCDMETSNSARRLYERDVSNDSLNNVDSSSEQNDFAQFKAKFNSSVEALWKDAENDERMKNTKYKHMDEITSLPSSYQNLENFWTNYYNHHYNGFEDKKQNRGNEDTVDFLSMPGNLGKFVQDQIKKGDNFATATSTGGVFLEDSIWSENQGTSSNKNDDNLYGNMLTSSYKSTDNKIDDNFYDVKGPSSSSSYSFNMSKWSECSFETPFIPVTSSSSSNIDTFSNNNKGGLNKNELRENMLKNSYLYSFRPPVMGGSSTTVSLPAADLAELGGNRVVGSGSSSSSNSSSSNSISNTNNNNTIGNSVKTNNNISYGSSNNVTLQSTVASEIFSGSSFNMDEKNSDKKSHVASQMSVVTLSNHSKTSSGFIEYSRVKSMYKCEKNVVKTVNSVEKNTTTTNVSTFVPDDRYKQQQQNNNQRQQQRRNTTSNQMNIAAASILPTSPILDEENLLTSDRTHFRPIKQTYADGYQFEICNNFDEVNFERSDSGFLMFESEKYLEYTRIDTFLSDDEPAHHHRNNSMATAIGIRNPVNATVSTRNNNTKKEIKNTKRNEFALKFRIKQNEKCCQTDPSFFYDIGNYEVIQANIKNMINSNDRIKMATITKYQSGKYEERNSNNDYLSDNSSSMVMNDDKYRVNCSSNSSGDGSRSCSYSGGNNSKNSKSLLMNNAGICEENEVVEEWSMAEIGRRCFENNNVTHHTLWGMCAACSKVENESLPANRLLKDELNVEADEIMSDLKYMQDLYIGSDWEDGENRIDDDDENDDDNEDDDDDTDCDAEQIKEECSEFYQCNDFAGPSESSESEKDREEDHILYYNVTKLISDLLKPENAKTLVNALGAKQNLKMIINKNDKENDDYNLMKSVIKLNNNNNKNNNNNDENGKYIGGLWNNDENIIWKGELKSSINNNDDNAFACHNANFGTNISSNGSSISNKTSEFLEKLNWEYSNLAEIWKRASTETDKDLKSSFANNNRSNNTTDNETSSSFKNHIHLHNKSDDCSDDISCRNFKNLLSSNNLLSQQQDQHYTDDRSNKEIPNENLKGMKMDHVYSSKNIKNRSSITAIDNMEFATRNSTNNNINNNNNINEKNIIKYGNISMHSDNNNNNSSNNCDLIKIQNRSVRKRRHSASQNINVFSKGAALIGSSDAATEDLNGDASVFGNKIEVMAAKRELDFGKLSSTVNDSPTTIITCKYWATLDTTSASQFFMDKNSNYDGFTAAAAAATTAAAAVAMNPSSILKHVALVSRPLTR